MLKKMGWREGQGIGPKIKRKLRKIKSKMAFGTRSVFAIILKSILFIQYEIFHTK
jgi:hypothetical protein